MNTAIDYGYVLTSFQPMLLLAISAEPHLHVCGVYTIAFATSLCYGQDVMSIHYDRQMMRQHLVECLDAKKMFPFPSTYQEKKSQVYE